MAVAADCIWNIQTDGSAATAGGGFVTGATGTDYSKTLIASLPGNNTVTTATSAGAGNVLLTAQASADWVGNLVIPTAGTNMTLTAGVRYEILSVVVGVSVTFSTNISGGSIATGIVANGAFIVGGAAKFYNSSTDDTLLENSVAGHIWYIKRGAHSLGALSLGAGGTTTAPIKFIGYNATQGDAPTIPSGNQPIVTIGASSTGFAVTGGYTHFENFTLQGTNSFYPLSVAANGGRYYRMKIYNYYGAGASTAALNIAAHGQSVIECELINTHGAAITANVVFTVVNSWLHDSQQGVKHTGTTPPTILNNLFTGNTVANIVSTSGTTGVGFIRSNTFYGYSSSTPVGIGVDLPAGSILALIENNIFYGLVTGVNHATANQATNRENYNNFFGNTTNRTNFAVGPNSIAVDPAFVNVTQLSYTGATITSNINFVKSGATFVTDGVVAGTHYLNYYSGTGATIKGSYGIVTVTETTITTKEALVTDATTDHNFYITKGFNWAVGTNMKSVGTPGLIASSSTTSHVDIGAVQRLEDYPVEGDAKTGTVYSNGELTGTGANIASTGGQKYKFMGPN